MGKKSNGGEFKLTPDKIGTDGVYDVEMALYHGDCCIGPSATGTDLIVIEQQSLAHYWWQSYSNPERDNSPTVAMLMGQAAHYLVLGETQFAKNFVISPYEKFQTNEAKEWRDKQRRTILKKEQFETIGKMAKVLSRHPFAKNAFRDGKPEQSIIWKDKETGLWLKSRPDWMPARSPYVANFKTAANAKPADWIKRAYTLGYHQKEALRVEGFRVVTQRKIIPYFVVQETEAPYAISLPMMRETDLEIGHILNRAAIRRLADAFASGKFPGYADDRVIEMRIPAWTEKEFLDRHAAGEFESIAEAKNAAAERGPAKEGLYGH